MPPRAPAAQHARRPVQEVDGSLCSVAVCCVAVRGGGVAEVYCGLSDGGIVCAGLTTGATLFEYRGAHVGAATRAVVLPTARTAPPQLVHLSARRAGSRTPRRSKGSSPGTPGWCPSGAVTSAAVRLRTGRGGRARPWQPLCVCLRRRAWLGGPVARGVSSAAACAALRPRIRQRGRLLLARALQCKVCRRPPLGPEFPRLSALSLCCSDATPPPRAPKVCTWV